MEEACLASAVVAYPAQEAGRLAQGHALAEASLLPRQPDDQQVPVACWHLHLPLHLDRLDPDLERVSEAYLDHSPVHSGE